MLPPVLLKVLGARLWAYTEWRGGCIAEAKGLAGPLPELPEPIIGVLPYERLLKFMPPPLLLLLMFKPPGRLWGMVLAGSGSYTFVVIVFSLASSTVRNFPEISLAILSQIAFPKFL